MSNDIINSKTLRRKFPKHYQDLFSNCQIVVSSSNCFFWIGEYARFFGGLVIQQKLPTKCLVGLEILDENKVEFAEELWGYNPTSKVFEAVEFENAKKVRVIEFLNAFWPTLRNPIKGFRIHVVNESRFSSGLGTSGVLLTCLATAMALLMGKVTPQEIDEWPSAKIRALLSDKRYGSFREVYRLAWRITAISSDGNSSGSTNFTTLIKSAYPVVFLSKNINDFLQGPPAINPKDILQKCHFIESVPYWGSSLEEMFNIKSPQAWPIDIARVFTGTLINTENAFRALTKIRNSTADLQMAIDNELNPLISTKGLDLNMLFGYDVEHRQKTSDLDYLGVFHLITVKLLLVLRDLLKGGWDEDNMRNFMTTIRQVHDFNHFLHQSTEALDEICQRLTRVVARENEFNLSAAKVEGIGKGGNLLVFGPAGSIGDKARKQMKYLAEDMDKDISLDWATWIDGFGEDGVEVEQFLPAKKYSPFISADGFCLTEIVGGAKFHKIIDQAEIEKFRKQFDLFLFEPEHRIYIRGRALSSKDISSAKATIEILKKICQSRSYKISNKTFNHSSYGQSRYDLQSKIFIPLGKNLKKFANKKLNYQISGGMYENYSVGLNPNNLKIALVENLER